MQQFLLQDPEISIFKTFNAQVERKLTQEEILAEAKKTEKVNLASLQKYQVTVLLTCDSIIQML